MNFPPCTHYIWSFFQSHQHPMHGEGSHHEEIERTRLCFVCCNPVSDKNFESIKASMNHSHAPLLVLLTDVLGYKLEDGRLHSQVGNDSAFYVYILYARGWSGGGVCCIVLFIVCCITLFTVLCYWVWLDRLLILKCVRKKNKKTSLLVLLCVFMWVWACNCTHDCTDVFI